MLSYTIELIPRGNKDEPHMWTGKAVCAIDAIQLAKASVFPKLHTARVVSTRDEPEGDD